MVQFQTLWQLVQGPLAARAQRRFWKLRTCPFIGTLVGLFGYRSTSKTLKGFRIIGFWGEACGSGL